MPDNPSIQVGTTVLARDKTIFDVVQIFAIDDLPHYVARHKHYLGQTNVLVAYPAKDILYVMQKIND